MKLLKTTLLLAALCPYVMAAADPQPEIKSETLLRTSSAWNDVHYEPYSKGAPQLSILRITIPPHSTMKWHTHPMPNAAYIISGVVPETVNTLHRGVTGDQGVVLIVFYAGVQGMPLAEIKQ